MNVGDKIKNTLWKRRRAVSDLDIVIVVLILVIIFVFTQSTKTPKVAYDNPTLTGIDVSKDPEQSVCYFCDPLKITVKNINYTLTPVANYKICGMVLAKNTFFLIDGGADVAPIDVGLAWGKMAEPEYDKYMSYSSSNRFLQWNYKRDFPFSYDFLNSHVSHNHIIPADENILRAVNSFKNKENACMEGYLVNLRSSNNFIWNTSISRFDREAGACELFYVKKVRIGNNFYE